MAEENRSELDKKPSQTVPDIAPGTEGGDSAEALARRDARRRILAGGLAGAPLILTLSSRSAFASHCSVSGMMSGNLSSPTDIVCTGRTPGYWKAHAAQWPNYDPGTCNPINNDHGQCTDYSIPTIDALEIYIANLKQNDGYKWKIKKAEEYLEMLQLGTFPEPYDFFGTPFSEIFGGGYTTDQDLTLMQALWHEEDGYGPSILAHIVAAYLNALAFGEEAFGLSPDGVVTLFHNMISSDAEGLKDTLEMLNDRPDTFSIS